MSLTLADLSLDTIAATPWGWPYRQLRIPQAHRVTRGSAEVIVAVIDLGYRRHPHHRKHLWRGPRGEHGWDCHDDDGSLEYVGRRADTPYYRNHHAFVVGEVIACAPRCKVMVVRVGYDNPSSWGRGVNYAVSNGARILVMPHGFISHGSGSDIPLFYKGTDFSYPMDNPELRRALDDAYDAGCVVCKGTADNRGRRVASPIVGHDVMFSVGSTNPSGTAADICCSADYVDAATPGGERSSPNDMDFIWSTGGDEEYVSFTGGCMASGFAGGVAALVASRFPGLSTPRLQMILRNTAAGVAWEPRLGWGVLDAHGAVSLDPNRLRQDLRIDAPACRLIGKRKLRLTARIANRGAFDVQRALVVAFDGNPLTAAAPRATIEKPQILLRKQIGHAIGAVRGLHAAEIAIDLTSSSFDRLYLQVCSLDHHGQIDADTRRLDLRKLRGE